LGKSTTTKRNLKLEPVTVDTVRKLAMALPGVEEGSSYGTPAFKVNKKLLARFHQDGESLVVKVEFEAREALMSANPETFYITDHYRDWPWMLVRLSKVDADELRQLLEESWRRTAPMRMVAAWEARDE